MNILTAILILIIISLVISILLMLGLFYHLGDQNWADEFVRGKLSGKDLFTRIIKFLQL